MSETKRASTHRIMLGTAGHIDHGKSSLIQALTGTDPDRLAEEKQRGITIELGFAELPLPDGSALSVVDVPGHERFVRQMIAGATGIDLALLCIAADDGIMPQTIEHVAVLELLGVRTCVIALTKTDLVDEEWVGFVSDEIRSFLADTPYADAAIVPVSSRNRSGLDDLKKTLAEAAKTTKSTKESPAARLPVDRVFTIKGAGTVVTGTLWSGRVAVDDELEVLPSGTKARVRSILQHGRSVDVAEAGVRTALNLNALKTSDVRPGDFLASPGSTRSTDRFDAWLTYLDAGQGAKPLESGCRVHVAHGTREVIGRVLLMDGQASLAPRQSAYAQIRLDEPLPVTWQDRFVVRSYSPVRVVGGGEVLAAHPRRRTNLSENDRALLDALRSGDEDAVCDAALASLTHAASAAQLAEAAGLDEKTVARRLDELKAKGSVLSLGEGSRTFYAPRSIMARDAAAIDNALLRFHTENPLELGIAKAALMQRCFKRIDAACFDALLQDAAKNERILMNDGVISHPQAGGGAKQAEEQTAAKLAGILAAAGATPPTVADLIAQSGASSSLAFRALGSLEKQGRVVKVNAELCFDAAAYAAFEQAAVRFLQEHDSATAADLKEAMGTTRKYAMPVLEHLDAKGITVRDGDQRRLRS